MVQRWLIFSSFIGLSMVLAVIGLSRMKPSGTAPAEMIAYTEPGKIPAQPVSPTPPPEEPPTLLPPPPRDLGKSLPSSRRELLDKLTTYADPVLPGPGGHKDFEVNTVYRGFYEAEPGKFRQIQLKRTKLIEVEIETVDGRHKKWSDDTRDLLIENFNNDPYSLAITFPDQRVMYTKYFAEQELPEYQARNWRVLKGWIVSAGGGTAQRVALIDATMPELEDLKVKNKFIWPQLGVIQKILLGPLP